MSALSAYVALTGIAEACATPWRAAAIRAGGARAERFGLGDARGATWLHAASMGEVQAALPLVAALASFRPGEDLLVSASTRSGLDAWRRAVERRPTGGSPVAVCAWPLDFPGAVARAFERRRPRRLLVVETEIWPNALRVALGAGVRVAFANARLSARRWATTRLLRPVVAPLLARVSACAAQGEDDARRWRALGLPAEAIAVTGNTKYDVLPPVPDAAARAAARARFGVPAGTPLWVWGSVRPGEEDALAAAAHALSGTPGAPTLVAVPRHPARAPGMAARLGGHGVRVEPWSPGQPWPAGGAGARLVWAPVLGILRELYAAAAVATVGGSFAPYGGHNVAEPAALGVPVLVGPSTGQVEDAVGALIQRGGGARVASGAEAARVACAWLGEDAGRAEERRVAARRAIEDLSGASVRTLAYLEARGFWG